MSVRETNYAIHKIEIFPVDSVISLSNNSGPRLLSIVTVSNVLGHLFLVILFLLRFVQATRCAERVTKQGETDKHCPGRWRIS